MQGAFLDPDQGPDIDRNAGRSVVTGSAIGQRLRCGLLAALCALAAPALGQARVVDTGQAQCCSSLVPQLPPQTYYGATIYREDDPRSQWKPYLATPNDPPAPIEELLERVELAEQTAGPMASELVPSLGWLASAYIADKRHRDAIASLRRGIHLARVNEGLYSPAQINMLEQLIATYVEQGNFAEADVQQNYLHRVRSFRKAADDPERLEATLRFADWIRGAYISGFYEDLYPNLVKLNDLHQNALDELEERLGSDSPVLLPYLQGKIELSYLVSVYPGEKETGLHDGEGGLFCGGLASQIELQFCRLRDNNFRYGLRALEQKRDILQANPATTPAALGAAQLAVADWYQWHRRYAHAIREYEAAWAMMADRENGGRWLEKELGQPLELPKETIFNPGPIPLDTLNAAEVSIRFDVSRHGEAKSITMLTPRNTDNQPAITRAYHYLRNVRFRPRLADGEVVNSLALERTYKVRY
ncbi:MAG: hypothetical protein Cons2KO_03250 [Congregibacter sp.]